MARNSRRRRIGLSIKRLVGVNKPNVTLLYRRDDNYRHYYFSKKLCIGVEWVAKFEHISKKNAAELLMEAGLSKYIGAKVTEQLHANHAARERNEKVRSNRFIQDLKRYAKSQGMDISGFF